MTIALVRVRRAAVALAALPLCAWPAYAQPSMEGRAALVQKLADCRKVADDTARLACFDTTAAALEQAEAKGDIVVVDRAQAQQVRRQAFGFRLPSLSVFDRGDKPEEVDSIESQITTARTDPNGKWILQLEDGSTWTQIDVDSPSMKPRAGMPVKIRKATMGSFLLSVDGRRAFRARRTD